MITPNPTNYNQNKLSVFLKAMEDAAPAIDESIEAFQQFKAMGLMNALAKKQLEDLQILALAYKNLQN